MRSVSKTVVFSTVLAKADGIIKSIRGYPKLRRKQRLYRQWAEKDGLVPEIIAHEDVRVKDAPPRVIADSGSGSESSEAGESSHQENVSEGVPYQSTIPAAMRDSAHEAATACAEPYSHPDNRKVAMFMMAEINKEQLRLAILLMLLGASLVIFCLGFILLVLQSLRL